MRRRVTGAGESHSPASAITSITLARLLARNLAAKAAKIRTQLLPRSSAQAVSCVFFDAPSPTTALAKSLSMASVKS